MIDAAKVGNLETVKTALNEGADINFLDRERNTALTQAIINSHVKVASYLLLTGKMTSTAINTVNVHNCKALIYAYFLNNPTKAQIIFSRLTHAEIYRFRKESSEEIPAIVNEIKNTLIINFANNQNRTFYKKVQTTTGLISVMLDIVFDYILPHIDPSI